MNCDNFFYPLRPRSARSRPPILGGQLIETEEHKDRFLRVGCCFNDGLIRVLQTHALVGVVCRAGGIASLYPRLLITLCVPCFARLRRRDWGFKEFKEFVLSAECDW